MFVAESDLLPPAWMVWPERACCAELAIVEWREASPIPEFGVECRAHAASPEPRSDGRSELFALTARREAAAHLPRRAAAAPVSVYPVAGDPVLIREPSSPDLPAA